MPEAFELQGVRIDFHEGDLARLPFRVDALVSSDDNHLSRSSGVSAALFSAADDPRIGEEILATLAGSPDGMRLGQVVRTSAGRLQADHLLHAVTIDLDRGILADQTVVESLTLTLASQARRLGIRHLALPVLASGAAGLPLVHALEAMLRGLDRLPAARERLHVTLVVPKERADEAHRVLVEFVRRRGEALETAEKTLRWAGRRLPEPLASRAGSILEATRHGEYWILFSCWQALEQTV